MAASNVVDIEVKIHWETEDAWLVSTSGEKKDAVWVPKSKVEMDESDGGIALMTIPEWLATEKGFV